MSVDETHARSTTGSSFTRLNTYQFALLKTFRKSGEAVPTPIWFALENGKLYFMTGSNAGKLKRIRNNGHVILIPCDARGRILSNGKEVEGQAGELPASEHQHARSVLARKYGLQWRLFNTFMNLRGAQRTFVEIIPV